MDANKKVAAVTGLIDHYGKGNIRFVFSGIPVLYATKKLGYRVELSAETFVNCSPGSESAHVHLLVDRFYSGLFNGTVRVYYLSYDFEKLTYNRVTADKVRSLLAEFSRIQLTSIF